MKRRKFLQNASLTGIGVAVGASVLAKNSKEYSTSEKSGHNINSETTLPLVIATWNVPNATNKAGQVWMRENLLSTLLSTAV